MDSKKKEMARQGLDLANHMFSYVDALFACRKRPERPTPMPLFIVGVPRSGTTLTYQLITQQLSLYYFTEIMGYLYGMPNLVTRLLKPFINRPRPVFESHYGKIAGFLAPSEDANFWFRWFPRTGKLGHYVEPSTINENHYKGLKTTLASMAAISGKPLVFKNVYLSMVVGVLAQLLPHAKFIVVKRDPLLTCQSILTRRLKGPHPQEWWSVKPPQYHKIHLLPIWQQVTEQVFYVSKILERDMLRYAAGRYFEIEYENLCQNPGQVINDLAKWLKPAGYNTYPNQTFPERFQSSNELVLDDDLAAKISNHLQILEEQKRF